VNNKPILIVICDFIVLSMMTLILGLEGPQQGVSGSAGPEYTISELSMQLENQNRELLEVKQRLAELRHSRLLSDEEAAMLDAINKNLADNLVKMEALEKQAQLDRNTIGEKTAEELQQELIDSARRYAQLKVEAEGNNEDLQYYKNQAEISTAGLTATREELDKVRAKALADANALTEKERALLAAQGNLLQTEKQLQLAQTELEEQVATLTKTKTELAKTGKELADFQDQIKKAQLELSFANGKLSATEKELAETRGQLDLSRKAVNERDIKLAESNKQLSGMQNVVKKAVGELSDAKQEIKGLKVKEVELGQAKEQVATLQGTVNTNKVELANVQQQLAKAEADLKSNVFDHYAKSVRELNIKVADRRALLDHVGKLKFYLPEIQIGDRRFLAGEMLTLADLTGSNTAFSSVYELQYAANPAAGGDKLYVARNIFSCNFDPRVALVEVNASSSNALSVIDAEKLRERGLQDLYLFHKGALGTESAALEQRVSMDAVKNEPYMFVRNSTNRNNSELKAEVGDFILTKQGELAGVVVNVETFDLNSRQEARVALFPADFTVENSTPVPLVKRSADVELYVDYIENVKQLFSRIKALEKQQRK